MTRRYVKFSIIAIVAFFAITNNAQALFKSAKVTLVVVDESGKPIEGVDAGVGFEKNTGWDTETKAQRGSTDAYGRFTATGSCNGHIGYGGRKEGYYRSHYDFDFKKLDTFGWKPWNPELKIVMRKIENPVPMYARNTKFSKNKLKIPVVGKEVGFDLIVYDWVPPYGHGHYADFIFYLEKKFIDRDNYTAKVTLKFPNKFDGIIKIAEDFSNGSQYKLPRIAPLVDYKSEISFKRAMSTSGTQIKEYKNTDNYVFRVRSEENDGKFVKAIYGKVHGPISFDPREEPTEIYFTYYLNPDYTRNLEFDPKRNLFRNLTDMEQVNEP